MATVAKLFEICVLQRIEEFDMDILVSHHQHGFRRSHRTDSAIWEVTSIILEGLNTGKKVGMYSADITAAFNLLKKEKLVKILKAEKLSC